MNSVLDNKYTQINATNAKGPLREASNIINRAFRLKNTYAKLMALDSDIFLVKENIPKPKKTYGCYILTRERPRVLNISTAALKPEIQNTKTGYEVIHFTWYKILDFAKKNKYKTLTLDVDAKNKNLLKLYKKFGFKIVDKYYCIWDLKSYYKMARSVDETKEMYYPAKRKILKTARLYLRKWLKI